MIHWREALSNDVIHIESSIESQTMIESKTFGINAREQIPHLVESRLMISNDIYLFTNQFLSIEFALDSLFLCCPNIYLIYHQVSHLVTVLIQYPKHLMEFSLSLSRNAFVWNSHFCYFGPRLLINRIKKRMDIFTKDEKVKCCYQATLVG